MKLRTPLDEKVIKSLKAGDMLYLSGTIYTGRDAAHQKLVDLLKEGEELPVNLKGQTIYYVGPAPKKPGRVIGSAGPTSSYRMDPYAKTMMSYGLKVMIGKGSRSDKFIKEMLDEGGVYLQAIGGLGALLAEKIKSAEVVAFPELGAEAIYKLEVEDFPVVVTYDAHGGNLIKEGIEKYRRVILWKSILKEEIGEKLIFFMKELKKAI